MNHILLLLLCLLTSCASYQGTQSYSVVEDVYYTSEKTDRLRGEVYVPKGAGPFPGVVLVHGGGWQLRDLSDMRSIAKSLASHGFVVFNINYRLAPKHRHPVPVDDLASALAYFKSHAELYRLDPAKLGLWGYSSGGHTVSYYALVRGGVQAVVTGGAPYDFTWYPKSPYIKAYTGAYRNDALEKYVEASVVNKVTESSPPFFIYHAKEDRLVEFAQATNFEARFLALKRPVKRHDISWWGHAFAFALNDEAVEKGVEFLQKNLR